jgi:hypothetical protein
MGAYEDFGAVCGPLNAAQKAELGKFAANMTGAACRDEVGAVAELMKEAAKDISNFEDLEALLGVFEYIEKVAKANWLEGLGVSSKVGLPAALLGVSAVFSAAPIIGSGVKWAARTAKISKSRAQIKREHPELRDDPYFERYFEVLRMFSPDVAANPLIAGNVMRELHRLGPEALTPTKVKELLSLQRDFKGYQNEWHQPAANAATLAMKASTSDFATRATAPGGSLFDNTNPIP